MKIGYRDIRCVGRAVRAGRGLRGPRLDHSINFLEENGAMKAWTTCPTVLATWCAGGFACPSREQGQNLHRHGRDMMAMYAANNISRHLK